MAQKVIFALFAVLTTLQASAFDFTFEGQTLSYSVLDESAKTCEVVYKYGVTGAVSIPATVVYNNVEYTVASIGKEAFNQNSRVTEVNLPETIVSIGDRAFYNCQNITSLNIPITVTSIGEDAFCHCGGLSSVTLSNEMESISNGAFAHTTLSSVTLPENLSSIENRAFVGCKNLKNIIIPNSVTFIGQDAFSYSGLTSIVIPESVTEISDITFYDCESLESVTLPNTLKSIGASAFYLCTSLTSIVIPESVMSVGIHAFEYCSKLTSVKLPENLPEIARYTFCECPALKDVNIPRSITAIGTSAFYGCKALETVFIPGTVTSIGERAFYNCTGLKEVCYDTAEPVKGTSDIFPSWGYYNPPTLYVAFGGLNAAKATVPWCNFRNIKEKYFGTDPLVVTVKLPGGNLHFPEEAAGLTVRLTADNDFELHSATLDGEDVTHLVGDEGHFTIPAVEKPTMLNVVFKGPDDNTTDLMDLSSDTADEVRVTVYNKRVSIVGKQPDVKVRAYNLNGLLIEDTTADEFILDYCGVVILTVGHQTFKFAL